MATGFVCQSPRMDPFAIGAASGSGPSRSVGDVTTSTILLDGARSYVPIDLHQASMTRVPVSPISLRTNSPSRQALVKDFVHVPQLARRTPDLTPPVSALLNHSKQFEDECNPLLTHTSHNYAQDRRSSVETNISHYSNSCESNPSRNYARARAHPYYVRDHTGPRDSYFTSSEDLTPPEYTNATNESNRASFFMPTTFEHHHAKARKRSNLPKQSTDVMKTWFDQVNRFGHAQIVLQCTDTS
nr:hypothetical protein CFP56_36379 [Quercus suber]